MVYTGIYKLDLFFRNCHIFKRLLGGILLSGEEDEFPNKRIAGCESPVWIVFAPVFPGVFIFDEHFVWESGAAHLAPELVLYVCDVRTHAGTGVFDIEHYPVLSGYDTNRAGRTAGWFLAYPHFLQ